MKRFPAFTIIVAVLLALGEIGRWWGDPRFLPLVLDELLVTAAMLGAALAAKRVGPFPLAAAWGAFCGLALSLLVPTLDHLLHGPPKESAVFYSVILLAMLAVGIWGEWQSLRLCREQWRER